MWSLLETNEGVFIINTRLDWVLVLNTTHGYMELYVLGSIQEAEVVIGKNRCLWLLFYSQISLWKAHCKLSFSKPIICNNKISDQWWIGKGNATKRCTCYLDLMKRDEASKQWWASESCNSFNCWLRSLIALAKMIGILVFMGYQDIVKSVYPSSMELY